MAGQDLTGQLVGRNELREVIGVGGMAIVYRAHQPDLKREVALKVVSATLSQHPGSIERFIREAEMAASLEHQNIVPIHDFGIENGVPYIVMRLLNGGSLGERMTHLTQGDGLQPSLGEIATMLQQLASALDYAHGRALLHRDVKPSNIMFDQQGSAYLLDFGIAKLLEATGGLTTTGMAMGTPAYMSPEQWRADELTPAADQYALGALVYALVTGHAPFEAPTPYAWMHKHLNEMPTPAHIRASRAPEALTAVLERAMAKDPTARFPTVTAFAQAFARAISGHEGEPTGFFTKRLPKRPVTLPPLTPGSSSRPRTAPVQTAQPLHRRPLMWAIGVMTLLLLAFGAILVLGPDDPPASTPTPDAGGQQAAGPIVETVERPAPTPSETPSRTPTDSPTATLTLTPTNAWLYDDSLTQTIIAQLAAIQTEIAALQTEERLTLDAARSQTAAAWTDTPSVTPTLAPDLRGTAAAYLTQTQHAADTQATQAAQTAIALHAATQTQQLLLTQTDSARQATEARGQIEAMWRMQTATAAYRATQTQQARDDRATQTAWSGALTATAAAWTRTPTATLTAAPTLTATPSPTLPPTATPTVTPTPTLPPTDAPTVTASPTLPPTATGTLVPIPLSQVDPDAIIQIALWRTGSVWDLEWSPDGKALAAAVRKGVWLYRAGDPMDSGHLLEGYTGWVDSVVWSPDGAQLASASDDGTVRLWDAASGQASSQAVVMFEGYTGAFGNMAWSPHGLRLVSGSWEGTIRLWDAASGQAARTLEGHTGPVWSVVWSPNGTRLASGSDDGTVRVWDTSSGQMLRLLEGHTHWVSSVAWSPNGGVLASGDFDGTVRVWDTSSGQMLRKMEVDTSLIQSVAWSPDGSLLAVGGSDGELQLWDVNDGMMLRKLKGHVGEVDSLAWSPDGAQLASGSSTDLTLRLWGVEGSTVAPVSTMTLPPTESSIGYGIEAWRDGDMVLTRQELELCETPIVTTCAAGLARAGENGMIVDGPMSSGEHWWWRVEFTDGRVGWIAQVLLSVGAADDASRVRTAAPIELPEIIEAPGGSTMQYPRGWIASLEETWMPAGFLVLMFSSEAAGEAFADSIPLPSGETWLLFGSPEYVLYSLQEESLDPESPESVLQAFRTVLIAEGEDIIWGDIHEIYVGMRPGAVSQISTGDGDGFYVAYDLGGGAIAIAAAMTAPGESSFVEPLVMEILGSVTYEPSQATQAVEEIEAPALIDCETYDLSEMRIGLVTDVGQINDKSFNQSSWEGVLAATLCGAEVDYIETADAADYADNIAEFAENDYNVIVTVGFALGPATLEAAATYPDVTFIGVDQFYVETVDNVAGLVFNEDQSGFLAGVLAARLSETGTIAAVLGTDQVPPVVAFNEGYMAGARYVNPDINIISTYHPGGIDQAFTDPEWGATTARQALDQNADVVFGAGGKTGNGALIEVANAVGEDGPPPYCIGVDTDQWDTVPEAHACLVSSAIKVLDKGVADILMTIADGTFAPGNFFGAAALAPFHDFEASIPTELTDELVQIAQGLGDGTISTGYGVGAPAEEEAILNVITIASISRLEPMPLPGSKGNTIAFSSDSRLLASTGSGSGEVSIWDVGSRRIVQEFIPAGGGRSVAFSPDGQLAVGTWENITIWDPTSGRKIRDVADARFVDEVEYSPSGDWLAAGDCTTVRVWNTTTWEQVFFADFEKNGACPDIEFSPNGRYLAYGVNYGNGIPGWTEVVDFLDNSVVGTWEPSTGWDLSFSPDGDMLLTADGFTAVDVLRTDNWTKLFTLDDSERVFAVDYHPEGHLFATGGMTVRLWDRNGNLLRNLYPETEGITMEHESINGERNDDYPDEQAWTLSFSPDGTMLAVAGFDEPSITIWSLPKN